MKRLLLLWIGPILLAACSGASSDGPARVEVGLPAPAYSSQTLSGDSVSLASLRDKGVLLNVWATWCHPCRTEIPELRAKEFDMQYPVWRDPGERVSTQFLVIGVPATFLIDRKGILRWRKTGPIAPGDTSLAGAINRAVAN